MELSNIREGLQPFLAAPLSASQLRHISMYIDSLLRWNARVNLTSVRQPQQILARHFGESMFAAQELFRTGANDRRPTTEDNLVDLGSGAGFPGLPIKICYPELRVTLIESNQKKATFLREVVRGLALTNVDVFCGRAEGYAGDRAAVVTLRAVERFDEVLPVAASLVAPAGRLALLIGAAQGDRVPRLAPNFAWAEPLLIPLSSNRVLLVGNRASEPT
jgi:16S rRNA (guanine527-N7)-methyltransferase